MPALERTVVAIGLTVAAYALAVGLKRKGLAGIHPSVLAAPFIVGGLWLLRWNVREYQSGSELLSFLIGPATVAMAVPAYQHRGVLRRHWQALLASVLFGCLLGIVTSVAVALLLGMSRDLLLSVAPKSVSSPIALSVSERLGGIPSLSVALAQATGILGATFGPAFLNLLGVRNKLARGLALGAAAHSGGTERALQSGGLEGAAGTLALGLNAVLGTLLIPPVVELLLLLLSRT